MRLPPHQEQRRPCAQQRGDGAGDEVYRYVEAAVVIPESREVEPRTNVAGFREGTFRSWKQNEQRPMSGQNQKGCEHLKPNWQSQNKEGEEIGESDLR